MRFVGEGQDEEEGYPEQKFLDIGGQEDSPLFKGAAGGDDSQAGATGDGDISNPSGNSETPRERSITGAAAPNPEVSSTPRKPMTPDIGAGSVEQHGDTSQGKFTSRPSSIGASTMGWGAPSGVIPFQPMRGGPIGSPGGSKSTLFGMAGGLKGGGLGVPSIGGGESGSSDLIDSLMSILKQKKGGMF